MKGGEILQFAHEWIDFHEHGAFARIYFMNGDEIRCTIVQIREGFVFTNRRGEMVAFPSATIRSIVFEASAKKKAVAKRRKKKRKHDKKLQNPDVPPLGRSGSASMY